MVVEHSLLQDGSDQFIVRPKKWPKNGRTFPLTIMKSNSKTKKPPASKNTAAYWQQKVFREEKHDPKGNSQDKSPHWVSAHYYVRIQVGTERRKFRLESTTAEEAGKESAKLYLQISANGWPAKKTRKSVVSDTATNEREGSVGQWIAAATLHAKVRENTAKKYAESLRTIVGDIIELSKSRKKECRAKIDNFLLDDLTSDKIRAWIIKRTDATGRNVGQIRRANTTTRTLVVNARSLFTSAIQESMGIAIEKQRNPFRSLKLPRKTILRYTSKFDARLLLSKATDELSKVHNGIDTESRYEQWKILYLALVAGLRYREIDNLRVQDVSPSIRKISIRTHDDYEPKTEASEADVTVSKGAAKVLEQMLSKTKGKWVVADGKSKKAAAYRTGAHHEKLLDWLRNYEERGIKPLADIHKPLHELRKEAGTLVNSQHGLYEAKDFLRHSDIATTAAYYVGSKGEITTGLS